MKVKYWKSSSTLSCFNSDFHLDLKIRIWNVDGESIVLYDPIDILDFIDERFLAVHRTKTSSRDISRLLQLCLYPSCRFKIHDKVLTG